MITRTRQLFVRGLLLAGISCFIFTILPVPTVFAADVYVNDGSTANGDVHTTAVGNDSNDGSSNNPYRTIQKALSVAESNTTIFIDGGTFTDQVDVDTSNVTIVGADSTATVIEPPSAPAIVVNANQVAVRNLRVQNQTASGIQFNGVDSGTISSVFVTGNTNNGILVGADGGDPSRDVRILDSEVRSSGSDGVRFNDVDGGTIARTISANNSENGIYISETTGTSRDLLVRNSLAETNGERGFYVQNSDSVTLRNNISRSHTGLDNPLGFDVEGTTSARLIGNTSQSNASHGFRLDGSDDARLNTNVSTGNGAAGFQIVSSSNARVRADTGTGNTGAGLRLDGSDGARVTFNLLANNGGRGLDVRASLNATALQNTLRANGGRELELRGGATADSITKNNILGNGTPGVANNTGGPLVLHRNYWDTGDSQAIADSITGDPVDYIPFRLDRVDTDPGADTVAPRTPVSFSADTSTNGQVKLRWDVVNSNESPAPNFNIHGYRIYRSTTPPGSETNWVDKEIASVSPSTNNTYTDNNVQTNTTYFYRVTAHDTPTSPQIHENESYFSTVREATPIGYGPGIYVNDTGTVNDVFTTRTGADTSIGTPKNPLRTLAKAVQVAEDGDSIYVDAGTYTGTASVDTPTSVTIIGAGSGRTVLDGNGSDTALTVGAGSFELRELAIRNYEVGVDLGASGARIRHTALLNNGVTGLHLGEPDGHVIVQNTLRGNGRSQVVVSGSPTPGATDFSRNNLIGSNGMETAGSFTAERNWWSTADSETINDSTTGDVDYIPHRLGAVDTGVGADTVAPEPPRNLTVDTRTVQQVTLGWDPPLSDEDGGPLTGLGNVRIHKITNSADTPDWTRHRVTTLSAGDTQWTDTDVTKNQTNYYRLTAVDNQSPENESYFTDVLAGTYVNRVPRADSFTVTTEIDSSAVITLTGSDTDGDALSFNAPPGTQQNGTLTDPPGPRVEYRPDTGFLGTDRFHYTATDGLATSAPGTVTVRVVAPAHVRVHSLTTSAGDTPVVAGSGDTVRVRAGFSNVAGGPGRVLRSASQITVRDAQNRVRPEFDVALAGTDTVVPGNGTAAGTWLISAPKAGQTDLIGNFYVTLDVDQITVESDLRGTTLPLGDSLPARPSRVFNVAPRPTRVVADKPDSGVDVGEGTAQSVTLQSGVLNRSPFFEPGASPGGRSIQDGDTILFVAQRGGGDTDTIDTPVVNPAYGFTDSDSFDSRIRQAHGDLLNQDFGQNPELVDNGLLTLSLWLNRVSPDRYLGDSDVLAEPGDVTVRNVKYGGNAERLQVVKLLPDTAPTNRWVLVDALDDDGDVEGSAGNYTIHFQIPADTSVEGAGFSVFQILAAGVATGGEAREAVVYPNPFVPYDGNPRTGEYGLGPDQGIHFGAGPDRGFPAGTKLVIYTVRGEEVAHMRLDTGGIFQWDARSRDGSPVASGVYIYRIETPDGKQKVGKLAIVR